MSPLVHGQKSDHPLRRVAILFAGGPAPAANAVISTAAASFLGNDVEVLGIRYGYSRLVQYRPDRPMQAGSDYLHIDGATLRRTRNTRGILIGTARTNPGKDVTHPSHLDDPERTAPLKTVYDALCSLEVDALISIGGDDTLKTANKLRLFQLRLPAGARRFPIVHLPKTIDNDYMGIDFTFGYFTAVEVIADEIGNLLADAESSRSYFLAETMGRSAGWLAYGAAIAGEASLVVSVEDIEGNYRQSEKVEVAAGEAPTTRPIMDVDEVVRRMVATMRAREEAEGKEYGVIVIAEGLAEYLPQKYLEGVPRDDHGHLSISQVNLGGLFANLVSTEYERQMGRSRKIKGLQLGYEARCARPHAFDVMLGSQLGVGAYRALVEETLDGVMVSVSGQLDLNYVSFDKLVDPETLATVVRYVEPNSDFHRLARFLETYVNEDWYIPGARCDDAEPTE
jgi:6-phosphofructokinase